MLKKIQLLVAGGKGEVVTGGTLAPFLGAKGRIGEHQIKTMEIFALIRKGIRKQNFSLYVVQHGIHQSQTVGIMNQFAAGKSLLPFKFCHIRIQVVKIVGVLLHILMGGNHKTKGATSWVIAPFAGLGLHQLGHYINKYTRGKVLPCTGFFFVGVFL